VTKLGNTGNKFLSIAIAAIILLVLVVITSQMRAQPESFIPWLIIAVISIIAILIAGYLYIGKK